MDGQWADLTRFSKRLRQAAAGRKAGACVRGALVTSERGQLGARDRELVAGDKVWCQAFGPFSSRKRSPQASAPEEVAVISSSAATGHRLKISASLHNRVITYD